MEASPECYQSLGNISASVLLLRRLQSCYVVNILQQSAAFSKLSGSYSFVLILEKNMQFTDWYIHRKFTRANVHANFLPATCYF